MAGWAKWKPGWANEKFFRRFAPNFIKQMFVHPGLKPCRRPWFSWLIKVVELAGKQSTCAGVKGAVWKLMSWLVGCRVTVGSDGRRWCFDTQVGNSEREQNVSAAADHSWWFTPRPSLRPAEACCLLAERKINIGWLPASALLGRCRSLLIGSIQVQFPACRYAVHATLQLSADAASGSFATPLLTH